MTNTLPLDFQYDHHKDCTPCPAHVGKKCDLFGTGAHEPINEHLMNAHRFSQDKIAGLELAARLVGKGETEILVLAHMSVLMFANADGIDHDAQGWWFGFAGPFATREEALAFKRVAQP